MDQQNDSNAPFWWQNVYLTVDIKFSHSKQNTNIHFAARHFKKCNVKKGQLYLKIVWL